MPEILVQTLATLAAAKALDPAWLAELGLADLPGGGIAIPYYGFTGEELFVRQRDNGRSRFCQPSGVPLQPYGLHRIAEARRLGLLYILEGESDCWPMWLCGLPALGMPGANTGRRLPAEALEGIQGAYVWQEPNAAGSEFVKGVKERLLGLGYEGRLHALSIPGVKDPADLWAANPQRAAFLAAIADAAEKAKPLLPERIFEPHLEQEGPREPEKRHAANGFHHAEPRPPRPEPEIPESPPWPEPPGKEAYYGLAGDIVRAIEPQTESDPVAILVQFLAMFGNAAGRKAYWRVENDSHYANLYVCLVGETAKGRKGTAMGRAKQAFSELGDDWVKKRVTSGLSSGEGLIKAVRDPVYSRTEEKREGHDPVIVETCVDAGVTDKRLLVVEPEFGRVLRVMEREGNTLSPRLREGWDHGNMTNLTKESTTATAAHLSIIAHVTQLELRRLLTDVETTNGLANRFIWTAVRRSKLLPLGGERVDLFHCTQGVAFCAADAAREREVPFDDQARQLWADEVYERLTHSPGGVIGAITNRAESQVRRLALVYALLDTTACVELPHLRAALALWDYSVRSCRWVFGDSTGDALADEILTYLRGAGEAGMSQTEISGVFGRHRSAAELGQSLGILKAAGLAKRSETPTKGRPAVRWQC